MTDEEIAAGVNLREIWRRRKKEWKVTQAWAAEKLEMTEGAVSKYLRSELALGYPAVLRWANLLDVKALEIRPDFSDLITSTADTEINEQLLQDAMMVVEMLAEEAHLKLKLDEKAKMVAIAYKEGSRQGEISKEAVRIMISYAVLSRKKY